MAEGLVPKVSNFGISKFNRPNETMDYTRWTAHEALSNNVYLPKSDVWSMGVLLWEVAALGGTPYAAVRARQELVKRITRGLLPNQPRGTSDQLYQLMLQCWQLDVDERPSFDEIVSVLSDFVESGQVRFHARLLLCSLLSLKILHYKEEWHFLPLVFYPGL